MRKPHLWQQWKSRDPAMYPKSAQNRTLLHTWASSRARLFNVNRHQCVSCCLTLTWKVSAPGDPLRTRWDLCLTKNAEDTSLRELCCVTCARVWGYQRSSQDYWRNFRWPCWIVSAQVWFKRDREVLNARAFRSLATNRGCFHFFTYKWRLVHDFRPYE